MSPSRVEQVSEPRSDPHVALKTRRTPDGRHAHAPGVGTSGRLAASGQSHWEADTLPAELLPLGARSVRASAFRKGPSRLPQSGKLVRRCEMHKPSSSAPRPVSRRDRPSGAHPNGRAPISRPISVRRAYRRPTELFPATPVLSPLVSQDLCSTWLRVCLLGDTLVESPAGRDNVPVGAPPNDLWAPIFARGSGPAIPADALSSARIRRPPLAAASVTASAKRLGSPP